MITSRRSFLGVGLALSAGAYRAVAAASDRIRVGFIGLGGMGTTRLRGFMEHPDVDVAGLCDVDEGHLARAAAEVEKRGRPKPPLAHDFRRLLERRDLDAVMIATPDHWHALPAVAAAQAGKDVFVEKPLAYSIWEGRRMAEAAREHGRITQLGTHVHNDLPNYRRVVELVRSGRLGKVERVYCWKRSERKGIGKPPDGPPPRELDYDFWLGPAPRRPYNPNRSHANFRYFWDYSGGVFADFWCHITDVAYWALDLKAPKRVAATGFRDLPDDNAETPNLLEATYEYAGLVMTWTLGPAGFPGLEEYDPGCAFQGSEATLVTGYDKHAVLVKGKVVPDFPHPDPTIPDSPGHIREFLDAIKSRRPTTCNLDYAYRLTKAGLLANIACRVNRTVEWDDGAERIVGDHEAERLTARRYRKPWRLG